MGWSEMVRDLSEIEEMAETLREKHKANKAGVVDAGSEAVARVADAQDR
jgi:hypothetical protein